MRRNLFLISVLFCLFCLPADVKAASEDLFENPNLVYEQFEDQVYNQDYEVKYGFAREGTSVYSDCYGSKQSGKVEKFSGIVIVSETESYVQIIYHKEEGYDIGWILQEFCKEEVKLYNGAEKQLLADGIYAIESDRRDRIYFIELIFEGNQEYSIHSIVADGYLEVEYDKNDRVTGLFWNKKNDIPSQRWELVREYDRFYIRNKTARMYLVPRDGKEIGLTPILDEITNQFSKTGIKEKYRTATWTFTRISGKNVSPHRNFLQYDPDWGSKEYGNVKGDYGGRMAAAGCGVVSIVNMVYALNGQFIDPMLLADFAVENYYRVIGSGTDDEIYKAAAEEFGQAYNFRFIKRCYNVFEMRGYLEKGCVAISYVPGHYVTIADYNEETEEFLVLDSHPIPRRPTSPWGDWFPWEKLESGGLDSSCYFIFEQRKMSFQGGLIK